MKKLTLEKLKLIVDILGPIFSSKWFIRAVVPLLITLVGGFQEWRVRDTQQWADQSMISMSVALHDLVHNHEANPEPHPPIPRIDVKNVLAQCKEIAIREAETRTTKHKKRYHP